MVTNIRPAVTTVGFLAAQFKRVPRPLGIRRCRFLLAEQFTQVEEVLLTGRPFRQRNLLPLGDELLGRHWEGS